MRRSRKFTHGALLLAAVRAGFASGCSDGGSGGGSSPKTPEELGIDLTNADRCDPLVPERCLLPLPNDFYTVADDSMPNGRRIEFAAASLPADGDPAAGATSATTCTTGRRSGGRAGAAIAPRA